MDFSFVLFVPGGDCSRLHDGGIGACYFCWLVEVMELMSVVLMLAVLENLSECYRYGSEAYTGFACCHNYSHGINILVMV